MTHRGRQVEQVRHRPARDAGRGSSLHHRPRPLCRRLRPAAPVSRRRGDVAARPCPDQAGRYHEGQGRARGAGRADRRRRPRRRARAARAADARGHGRTKGLSYAALHPRSREGARGRRPRRFRRRRDADAGEGCRRADRDRLRAAAGGRRCRGRGEARRAGGVGRGAQQHLVHADDGQQGSNRHSLCQCQTRRLAQAQQQPHHRQLDRAARRDRTSSSRGRQLHALLDFAEPARHALDRCRAIF